MLLSGCSSAPQSADCANGLKIALHPSMRLKAEDSISSPLLGSGQKFHARLYESNESQENLVKFFKSNLPGAWTKVSDLSLVQKEGHKEVKFYIAPPGSPTPTSDDTAEVPKNVDIAIRPNKSGELIEIQISELVPPPP